MDAIIKRLEEVRTSAKLNKKQFAKELDLFPQHYSDILREKRPVNLSLLVLLAKKYCVNLNWFLYGHGIPYLSKKASRDDLSKFKEIIERLEEYKSLHHDKIFSKAEYSKIVSRDMELTLSFLVHMVESCPVDFHWLITGIGSVFYHERDVASDEKTNDYLEEFTDLDVVSHIDNPAFRKEIAFLLGQLNRVEAENALLRKELQQYKVKDIGESAVMTSTGKTKKNRKSG